MFAGAVHSQDTTSKLTPVTPQDSESNKESVASEPFAFGDFTRLNGNVIKILK